MADFFDNIFPGLEQILLIKTVAALPEHDLQTLNNLVDGNKHTFYELSNTNANTPWIQIELMDIRAIKQIRIIKRHGFFKIPKLEVRIGNTEVTKENPNVLENNDLCGKYEEIGLASDAVVMGKTPLTGKYITLEITEQRANIAEVEIFGQVIGTSNI